MRRSTLSALFASLLVVALAPRGMAAAGACVQPTHVPFTAAGALLFDVDARTGSDAWAVGAQTYHDPSRPLAYHWDGTGWTEMVTPHARDQVYSTLAGVSIASANDVWAVGSGTNNFNDYRPLAVHWDGTSWRRAHVSPAMSDLTDVEAFAEDAWAVGTGGTGLVRWDGTSWDVADAPALGALYAIDGTSPTDIWAVGGGNGGVLVEHWDGAAWSAVRAPEPAGAGASLGGLSALAPDDAWAVGDEYVGGRLHGFVERWNGTRWRVVPAPTSLRRVLDVVALAHDDVWVAGYSPQNDYRSRPDLFHWDGTAWSEVPVPHPDSAYAEILQGVGGTAATGMWAVGGAQQGSGFSSFQPLAFREC